MIVTKRLDLPLLSQQLTATGVPHTALGTSVPEPSPATPGDLFTYDATGAPVELPPEAGPVVEAHVAPPLLIEYVRSVAVDTQTVTTDDQPHEVFRFPCEQLRRYRSDMRISGIDAGNFVSREMEGRFVWKRTTGNAIMVGITIVSTLGEAASSSWAPNALPDGTDVVFTVKGAAGRTINWVLQGDVEVYAPGGLEN